MDELLQIKGIGKATAVRLAANRIFSVADLIQTVPSRYAIHTLSDPTKIELNTVVSLEGTLNAEPKVDYLRKHLTKLSFSATFGPHSVTVMIYNREFMRSNLHLGTKIVATGKFVTQKQFMATDLVLASSYQLGILPEYRLEGIGDKTFAKLVDQAQSAFPNAVKETLPLALLSRPDLVSIQEYLRILHHPKTLDETTKAIQRIKYTELLEFALRLRLAKAEAIRARKSPKAYDLAFVKAFIQTLPYELTPDQKAAVNDIFRDFKKTNATERLLQGDVGSGKTAVAMIACAGAVSTGDQVALMVPTEILAYQHFETFSKLFSPFSINVSLLSGQVLGSERKTTLESIASGKTSIVIGTHALFQEAVVFHRLGFVIVDEQHRFGIRERQALRQKGIDPDYLMMSATPIPRTLAITLYGDAYVSTIETMPPGRKPIHTEILDYSAIDRVIRTTMTELALGHQAYYIAPLVMSGSETMHSVGEIEAILTKKLPKSIVIGVLHGQMPSPEKAAILSDFYANRIQVLIATTVIEVGLNVPNATVMAILDAERFGLSQLHQLRGRIGRGEAMGHCYIVSDQILQGENRFQILAETTDGFRISEEDLRQRGPGEIIGVDQAGMPVFRMANLIEDMSLFQQAIVDAEKVLQSQDALSIAICAKARKRNETYQSQ